MLHKLTNAYALGLFQRVPIIIPLLLSRVVWEHGEKVKHHTIVKQFARKSPGSSFSTALEVSMGLMWSVFV